MPLFEKTPVNNDEVKELVKKHWNVDLGEKIKDSQNQTFEGSITTGEETTKVVIRVTPNIGGKRTGTIDLELSVLKFLASRSLEVCEAYPALETGALQVPLGELSVSVFRYARGEPVLFMQFKWMLEKEMAIGLGKWQGRLHLLLDEYEDLHPEMLIHARKWDELHDGVLKDIPIDERDRKTEKEPSNTKPRTFGLIHGDINTSNYFWLPEQNGPHMFDWDQMQRSWRLHELSSSIWGVCTLQGAGSPITHEPCPEANEEQYTNWMVQGYEEATQTKVDREALARCVQIRRYLYKIFCTRALDELEPSNPMHGFCQFYANWLADDDKTIEKQ